MTQNIAPLAFPPTLRTHIATLLQTVFWTGDTRITLPRKSIPFRYPDGLPSRPSTLSTKQVSRARQRRSEEEQAIPAFATEYAPEQTIVATEARCVLFLPADSNRRFSVRVTMRTAAGGKVPWYEIETYHLDVKRWVVRQPETNQVRAYEVAQAMRLMDEPDDEEEQNDD